MSAENTPSQTNLTFQEVMKNVYAHLEARDWHHQSPRTLAVSIALEAAELLDHYQWSDQAKGGKDEVAAELADILIYVFHFAMQEGIDIPAAMLHKLEVQARKYPAKNFKGKTATQRDEAWLKAKTAYKKQGL